MHYTVKNEVCLSHFIWCAVQVSIHTQNMVCHAHFTLSVYATLSLCVAITPNFVCYAHR